MIERIQIMAPMHLYTPLETKIIAASIKSHFQLPKTPLHLDITPVRSSWWRGQVGNLQASSKCLSSNKSQSTRLFWVAMIRAILTRRRKRRYIQGQWLVTAWNPLTPSWGRRNSQQAPKQMRLQSLSNRMIQLAIALPSPCWARCRAH